MIERFKGPEGHRRLIDALRMQQILSGNPSVAAQIADAASLYEYQKGEVIIEQAHSDNGIHFICAGRVSVVVNGREVAQRFVRESIGEMALIDPSAPRSATVIALETTVVARIDEAAFTNLANASPEIWRCLAQVVAERLRQRNQFVRGINTTPKLFIGCSTEALPLAREMQSLLRYDKLLVEVWTDDVFQPSRYPLEDLQSHVEASDFAALILSPDDKVTSRATERSAPRDNVIFELGLFLGVLGRERVLLIVPRSTELKLPSDLAGITPLDYAAGETETLTARLAPVANTIRHLVTKKGAR